MKDSKSKVRTSSYKTPQIIKTDSKLSGSRRDLSAKSRENSQEKRSSVYDVRFKRKDLRQFNPRYYVSEGITEEDVMMLKEVFDYYDSTNIGVLLPNDLKILCQENGFSANKKTIYEIIAQYDQEEAGGISFFQFMKAMDTKPYKKQTAKQIHKIFKKYDRTSKGFITLEDIKEMTRTLNEDTDEEMMQLMIERASKNQDKKLTFSQFYEVMVKTVY